MTLGVLAVKHVKNLGGPPSQRRETNVSEHFSVAESDKMKTEGGHGHLPNVPLVFFNIPPQNEVVSELSGLPVECRLDPRFPTEDMIAGTQSQSCGPSVFPAGLTPLNMQIMLWCMRQFILGQRLCSLNLQTLEGLREQDVSQVPSSHSITFELVPRLWPSARNAVGSQETLLTLCLHIIRSCLSRCLSSVIVL